MSLLVGCGCTPQFGSVLAWVAQVPGQGACRPDMLPEVFAVTVKQWFGGGYPTRLMTLPAAVLPTGARHLTHCQPVWWHAQGGEPRNTGEHTKLHDWGQSYNTVAESDIA
jgi:hypothetical protein